MISIWINWNLKHNYKYSSCNGETKYAHHCIIWYGEHVIAVCYNIQPKCIWIISYSVTSNDLKRPLYLTRCKTGLTYLTSLTQTLFRKHIFKSLLILFLNKLICQIARTVCICKFISTVKLGSHLCNSCLINFGQKYNSGCSRWLPQNITCCSVSSANMHFC